jgi:hypothetical protein
MGGSSTTISPASARGASTLPTSSLQSFSCTVARIGSCQAHIASGARRCPSAELWLCPEDGHISVLSSSRTAMDWLREHAERG